MKKFFFIALALMLISGFGQTAFAAELPKDGEIVVGGGKGGEFSASCSDGEIVIKAPVLTSQLKKEGLKTTKWQLYGSQTFSRDDQWVTIPEDNDEDYAIGAVNESNVLTSHVEPYGDYRFYRFRVWGKDIVSGKWLWIDPSSPFYRLNKKGEPSYEFIADMVNCGEVFKVPEGYRLLD